MAPVSSPPADDIQSATDALRPLHWLREPSLREAATLLEKNQFGPAAKLVQAYLKTRPRDANALYLLAEAAMRQGRNGDAENILLQCLDRAPDFAVARFNYANALVQAGKAEAALAEAETLLKQAPRNPLFRRMKAIALEAAEDFVKAAVVWRALVDDYPDRPDTWMRYGHALRAMGATEDCTAAYRKAIALVPSFGGPWWSLADMKIFRFDEADIEQMERQVARADLGPEDRIQLLFALGKAYSDKKLYEKSFDHYARANALHRQTIRHDPDVLTSYVARCRRLFTADFFGARAGSGHQSKEPIFIVGMARSGSTLVEQILASHSGVEGTKELSNLAMLAHSVQNGFAAKLGAHYPEVLAKLDAADLIGLGERYLESVRVHRRRGALFFTDKMGSNFAHVGMLQLILPNAKIVDMRRHPMAAGFSIFAQHFPKGQNDAYRLADIGRLYHDYVALMAHFDRVLPGKVHRIFYENLVAEPEAEIRRLLDYLGLPFEKSCIEFYKTDRVVTTASSEQVRSPLYRDALEQWRHYEPWLGPLKAALGPVLDAYPDVPAFA